MKRSVSATDVFVNKETGMKRLIAADREGRVVVWDITAKKKLAENETDCGNIRCIFYAGNAERFVVVCESGAVLTFNDSFQQLDYFHVDSRVLFAKPVDNGCVMVATEAKELVTFNLETHVAVARVKVNSTEDIRCFDITADGKYAVIVSNEIQFWHLGSMQCQANLSPILPVRCMCLTSDFVSFFISQDTHIEKWVIDWKISCEGKKYYPPLSQYVMHNAVQEPLEEKESYKGTIETVKEEDEEEED